jgi:L-asparaginase
VRALAADGVAGLVVAGTGNGTLNQGLEQALLQAQQQGIAVRRSSRCAEGRVLPHAGDRLPAADGLSPVKARIALLLELMR